MEDHYDKLKEEKYKTEEDVTLGNIMDKTFETFTELVPQTLETVGKLEDCFLRNVKNEKIGQAYMSSFMQFLCSFSIQFLDTLTPCDELRDHIQLMNVQTKRLIKFGHSLKKENKFNDDHVIARCIELAEMMAKYLPLEETEQ